jgi:hypothetical protein
LIVCASSSPSELVQVRVLRKAPYVKVGGPVRREELNSNRKLYPKICFEHLILFKQNRFRPTVESPKSSTGTLTKHCVQKNDYRLSQVAHVPSVLAEKSTLSHATSIQKNKMESQLNCVIASAENHLLKKEEKENQVVRFQR